MIHVLDSAELRHHQGETKTPNFAFSFQGQTGLKTRILALKEVKSFVEKY